ncbi:MAG: N-acetyl sugar amidotransferase [Bacteroidetes bacterium]|jgi:N-acetyl sugar amidotransferase|nr:N-acetyl sugar amidotransferase [Bacteroidota bacterium]
MECKRCVLDESAKDIRFDENGVCNYCTDYLDKRDSILQNFEALFSLVSRIRTPNASYDCIVGVSGGLDSSFLLYKAKELGLRPLAVHIDTGWNSAISVSNIETITAKLQVDLHTFVLDWPQFRKMQVAYLRAGVLDLEFPTDHYYLSALYKVAADKGIRFILTGNNYTSEGIMPDCWIHNKGDTRNMLDIYRKYGNTSPPDKLPTLTLFKRFYYYNIRKTENIFLLNYLPYNREDAKQTLINTFGWKEYPVKHGESVFTRFYHRYILPKRFGVDIRRAHLSSLICNAQLSRNEALELLKTESIDAELLQSDKEYVLKKLGLTLTEFEELMAAPVRSHFDFRSEIPIKRAYNTFIKKLRLQSFLKISNRH